MLSFLKRKYTGLISDTRFFEIMTGSAWALSGRIVATIFGILVTILVARYYGAEILGVVAVINSFLILATIFTVLGTSTSILRLVPEHITKYSMTSAYKVYRKTQFLVIFTSVITGTIFFFSSNLIADKLFSKPHLSFYFAIASLVITFKSLMLLNTEAVRGLRLIKVFALMQVFPQAFNLMFLIAIGALWQKEDLPVYAVLFSYTMTGIIGWMLMEYAFKHRMKKNDKINVTPVGKILSISLPMLMSSTMAFAMAQTGIILLGIFRSEAEVGYYAIAVKLASLPGFILNAVNSIVGPKFSELFFQGRIDEVINVAKDAAKLLFWSTAPIVLILVVFGRHLIHTAFGAEFRVVYQPLLILVFGQFVHIISGSTGIFMNMTGNQNVYKNITFAAALVTVSLNLILIPQLGINGAALSFMVALTFLSLFTLVFIRIRYGKSTAYLPFLSLFLKK